MAEKTTKTTKKETKVKKASKKEESSTGKKVEKKIEKIQKPKKAENLPAGGEKKDDDANKPDRYYEAVGRRKSSTARVRIYTKGTGIFINDRDFREYFSLEVLSDEVEAPLKKMKSLEKFKISAKVMGGGIRGQAEAVRHGISRALVVFNADFKKRLKRAGYLKRDPRSKERKKYGLKKARKAPRWSKR